MAKTSGLGDNLYVHGYDLSGDVGSLSKIRGGMKLKEYTGINKSAKERHGLLRDGEISFNTAFDDATGAAHPALKGLPRTDVIVTYCRGTTLGNQAACMVAQQIDYNSQRTQDGWIEFTVQALSNAYNGAIPGLEWCEQLTAGKVTHASAANGTSLDYGAVSTLFGASAYWQLFDLASGTVGAKVQDSADNSSFADVTGLTFTNVADGSEPTAQRVATATGATIRRYVRVATTGTFTNALMWAGFIRHLTSTL